jgi:uncharacterized membrane protein
MRTLFFISILLITADATTFYASVIQFTIAAFIACAVFINQPKEAKQ